MNSTGRQFNLSPSCMMALAMTLCVTLCACKANPGVTTTSQFTVHMANVSMTKNDPTAITIVNPGQGNAEGCFAGGGPQPPSVPPGLTFNDLGTSPQAGQCHFANLSTNTVYPLDFISQECFATVQVFDVRKNLMADGNGIIPPVSVCDIPDFLLKSVDTHFARTAQYPSSLTFNVPGLSAVFGPPQLLVYDASDTQIGSSTATSVASDGSSATFPFPITNSGTPLSAGMYMFAVRNYSSNGSFMNVDADHFTVGGDSSMTTPFGVDAADITTIRSTCFRNHCSGSTKTAPTPLITLYNSNQLSYINNLIAVGNLPVAVKAFRTTVVDDSTSDTTVILITGPSLALVINSGSNSVSIVDLNQFAVVATVPVGSQPLTLSITPDETKAYVANFGSGSVSEIDLSTFTVTRTLLVGASPMSLAIDPAGTALWVGGQGYLAKVDLGSLAVITNLPVNGAVTSLVSSKQLNELVYSVVGNTSSSGSSGAPFSTGTAPTSSYVVNELNLSTLTTMGTFNPGSASTYAGYPLNGGPVDATATFAAAQISQQWNNGMGITATPTGFVIYDLTNHSEIMRGTTPTPIRGIASDPNNWAVYLTLPDSNDLITIPLPH